MTLTKETHVMLASVEPYDALPATLPAPITIRLIGMLDDVLVENFARACEGLSSSGARTLVVHMRDALMAPDEHLDRFVSTLTACETAGLRIVVDAPPMWRKLAARRGARFVPATIADGKESRRQIMLCHSADKRAASK